MKESVPSLCGVRVTSEFTQFPCVIVSVISRTPFAVEPC